MVTLPTDRLEDLVAAKRRDAGLPGVAAGIVADDGLAWFSGQGRADLQRSHPPTERSLARVASVTKTFTATAVLQLRDRGLLSLDDPLELHLPEFAAVQETGGRRADVTIRRLLTHRSGLLTESPPTHWDGPDGPDFPTLDAVLAALPETSVVIPADWASKYSNLAFGLLGEVVARLSGRSYAEHVQAEIFDRLGMTDSTFEPDARHLRLAMTGYAPGEYEDRPSPAPTASLRGMTAAGQLHTNVRDLAKWVAFQLRGHGRTSDGWRILSEASHEASFQPLYVDPDFIAGQCLAWRVTRLGEHVFHNHGGSVHGFNTSVGFHRPSRVGVIVLMNLWPTTAAGELALDLLETAIGGPAARSWARTDAPPPEAAPDSLRPFLGRYRAEPGIVSELVWRDGTLRFETTAGNYGLITPAVLSPIAGREGTFRFETGRAAGEEIAFDAPGESFTIGGFVYRRAR
jgi:D-alanyl-D-alanine carboxypeptidase